MMESDSVCVHGVHQLSFHYHTKCERKGLDSQRSSLFELLYKFGASLIVRVAADGITTLQGPDDRLCLIDSDAHAAVWVHAGWKGDAQGLLRVISVLNERSSSKIAHSVRISIPVKQVSLMQVLVHEE